MPGRWLWLPLSGAVVPWTPQVGESAVTVSDHGKLLQAESQYGLLLRINGKYCAVRGSTLTHLLNLEACSARCLLAAQRQISSISPACGRFRLRLRASTTDRASANLSCEKAMAKSLTGGAFQGLHLGCDVHVASRTHGRVFSLVEPTVTGVLRHALSLQGGAHMNLFRKAIRLEIRSRGGVVVKIGAASREARQHRELMLRLFAARGRCIISRRVLLMLLPNGDWRSRQVEVFVGHRSQLTPQEAERQLANGLVTALAGSQFEVYPRHRWTGADISFRPLWPAGGGARLGCRGLPPVSPASWRGRHRDGGARPPRATPPAGGRHGCGPGGSRRSRYVAISCS